MRADSGLMLVTMPKLGPVDELRMLYVINLLYEYNA